MSHQAVQRRDKHLPSFWTPTSADHPGTRSRNRCVRRSFDLTHSVELDLRLEDGTWPRTRAIAKEQFDLLIMEDMWGRWYTARDAESFSNQEQDLFSRIKLLLGCSKLLRTFNSIWIISRAFLDDTLSLFVAAELAYFLAFRLNLLFRESLGMWPSISSDTVTGPRQAVLLYGLEAVLRGLSSLGKTHWKSAKTPSSQYLHWLKNDLNECFKRVHDHIRDQTCGLPVQNSEPRRTQVLPHLAEFARARDKDLSKHLLGARYALLWFYWERHPEYLVTVDNKLVEYRDLTDLGYETHDGAKNSNSSTGGPTETAQFLIEQHPDPPQALRPEGSTFTTVGDDFILGSDKVSSIGRQGPNATVSILSPEELARISDPIPPPGSVGFCDSWGQSISDLQLWNFRPSIFDIPETTNDNDDGDDNLSDTSRVAPQNEIRLTYTEVLKAIIARSIPTSC
ncbi:uncharacterized protein Z519_08685 [Cladophialophora bantiana CBS 173.52]|uniref:Uncharacterized protein n=1 Tax=Cladophialophora bantiana (strain ATCC 10958 / CBS 173.52 / CDC B-1940 / NIH 8579) TaxID=1442370 RepID=A0A0D2FWL7_CLAB1|nr:uncharacterized protein Z519_08685 [Cladophialophora bantiana CBS 173.52]KIW90902.1 hypothetical protein Z519_08685 [Cladophialophora bantiana CBS 173.52]